jgi:RNA polymerase sigma-70 factor, ECF subfamily
MTALYTEHYAVLVSFISRYVRDRHKAEDQMQETLLRAWKHIDHPDTEPGRTRSYLLTIARNVVTTAWRAEQRRPERSPSEPPTAPMMRADRQRPELVEGETLLREFGGDVLDPVEFGVEVRSSISSTCGSAAS